MELGSLIAYIPSVSIGADWVIFGGLALFLTFDALRAGPSRVTALALALPIALLLSESIKHAAYVGAFLTAASPSIQTGAFIALTFGLFVALYRIVDTHSDSMNALQAAVAGVAAAVIVVIALLMLPDITLPWSFGASFLAVFSESYRLFWLLGAYIALAMARG